MIDLGQTERATIARRSEKQLFDLIRSPYRNLTENQKKLADFINSPPETVTFPTAVGPASNVSVGQPTVVRFAEALGYPGFATS